MMTTLVSELRKVRTTRLWWIMLIVVAVAGAGYAAMYGIIEAAPSRIGPGPYHDAFVTPQALAAVYNGGNTLTRILALVIGVMAMGAEYRHKTMGWSYLATPRRLVVVGAKTLSTLVYGFLYGLVSVVVGILVAIPMVRIFGGSMMFDSGKVWASLALGIVSLGLWALMGMGIGILIRNMIVAVLVAIGFSYMIEPLISVLFALKDWQVPLNLMPSGATSALIGIANPIMAGSSDPFPWWLAGLVLLAWAAIPTIIGIAVTVRRDV